MEGFKRRDFLSMIFLFPFFYKFKGRGKKGGKSKWKKAMFWERKK